MKTAKYRIVRDKEAGFRAQRRGWFFWRNIGISSCTAAQAFDWIHTYEAAERRDAKKRANRGKLVQFYSAYEAAARIQKF